jgi:aerobic C4-dicarboxylate transport protein
MNRTPFHRHLYVQVLVAIALAVALGHFAPEAAIACKPLGDGFLKLIRMLVAPIVFCTLVSGIAGVQSLEKVGRVGGKALLYFEVVSTLALVIGLVVAHLVQPGAGFHVDPATLDASKVSEYVTRAHEGGWVDHLLAIIPATLVDPFAHGDLLQVLLVALLFGFALTRMGETGRRLGHGVEAVGRAVFTVANMVMALAPLGAFGAMAFTVGRYGLAALLPMARLIGSVYLTSALFVVLVLGLIARAAGFSLFRFLVHLKDELLLVLATSSSESALPRLMDKLERLGCSRSVTGLVVPTGYSFNLDGTNIYMTMAALFIAQATDTPLTLTQQLTLLGVAMLTSKGASGITGAGFVTLAATLAVVPSIPVAGMTLILGIDRFMSECRSLTNFIGNGVATVVVAGWEGELDRDALARGLAGRPDPSPVADAPAPHAD